MEGMHQLVLRDGVIVDLWGRGFCGKHPLAEELRPLSHQDFLSAAPYPGPAESNKE